MRLSERRPAQAVEYLEAAAVADPLSAEPWRRLAGIEFERWRHSPNEESFRRFETANEKTLALVPSSAPVWFTTGERYLDAFSITGNRREIEISVQDFQHAADLYPNNALYRAKLAEAARVAGDGARFRAEAEAALNLDRLTPHKDKKLPTQTRDRLQNALEKTP